MSEHTPTPWAYRGGCIWSTAVHEKDGVGDGWVAGDDIDLAGADGRFIVRACNLYERMRDMLMKLAWHNVDGDMRCPECGTYAGDSIHSIQCSLHALLRDIEAAEKEPS